MPADDYVVQAVQDAAKRELDARHLKGTILYWRLLASVGAIAASMVFAFLVGWYDKAWFDTKESQDNAIILVSVVFVGATAFAHSTARRLSNVLRLYREREHGPRLFLFVLRDSLDYFREHKVPMGHFGPILPAQGPDDATER
jgi:hypothetical protein